MLTTFLMRIDAAITEKYTFISKLSQIYGNLVIKELFKH